MEVIGTYPHIPKVQPILPNVVGPWFPRRDGEESTKPFYYASMMALLKPWRDLQALKNYDDEWESVFDRFM